MFYFEIFVSLLEFDLSELKIIFLFILIFCFLEADLIEYFKKFGRVDDAIVMRDKQTNRGRGFGFVKI